MSTVIYSSNIDNKCFQQLHAVLKLTINCAINTMLLLTYKLLMCNFSSGIDISVFMLDILTVMGDRTTWPDYF